MALRKYFINLGADAGTAMVDSFTGESAMDEAQIAFRRDDSLDIELHFLNVNPAEDRQPGRPFLYVDPTGWTVKVGVGTIDATPTGGTFTLTDSAAGQTTAAIAYNASAATVQTAIRAALTTNFSACTVTGDAGGPWTIDRVTVGAFATDPTGTTAALTPSGSVAIVVNTEDGTASLSEKWQLSLASALPIYKESGWSALPSASVTVTTTQTGLGTPAGSLKNTIFRIQWNADAYAGTVSLRFTGDTSSGTVTLPYNATPAQVVAAFVLHTDVDTDGVVVVQNGPGDYTVECVGAGIKESAVPALVTAVNTLQVPLGLTARLACNTALVNSLLAGADSATASFEVEIQRSGSNAETVAYRDDATLYADLIRNVAGSSTATPTYPNVNSVVNFDSAITGYTGGGSTNLDGIATTSKTAGYYLTFVHATAGAVEYQLVAGTDAESSPDVIRPDDYNASTNAKVWKLKEIGGDVAGPGSATDNAIVRFDGTTGKLVQNSAVTIDDNGNVISVGPAATYFQVETVGFDGAAAMGTDAFGRGYLFVGKDGTSGSDIRATNLTDYRVHELPDADSKFPIASHYLTFSGPTAARTITLPDASFTAARTDAAQTFTGVQTMTSPVINTGLELGHASDTTLARSSAGKVTIEGKPVLTNDNLNVVRLYDEFLGGADGIDNDIGDLGWQFDAIRGSGTARMASDVNTAGVIGSVGIVTGAALRNATIIYFKNNGASGDAPFALAALNSSFVCQFRFRLSATTATARLGFGYQAVGTVSDNHARQIAIRAVPPSSAWVGSTVHATGVYVRPTVANGRRYYASTGGTSGGSEPTWPTTPGGTVADNTVTWTEDGADGNANFVFVARQDTDDTNAATADSGVAVDTAYHLGKIRYNGTDWFLSIDGGAESQLAKTLTGAFNTQFLIVTHTAAAATLHVDAWSLYMER